MSGSQVQHLAHLAPLPLSLFLTHLIWQTALLVGGGCWCSGLSSECCIQPAGHRWGTFLHPCCTWRSAFAGRDTESQSYHFLMAAEDSASGEGQQSCAGCGAQVLWGAWGGGGSGLASLLSQVTAIGREGVHPFIYFCIGKPTCKIFKPFCAQ